MGERGELNVGQLVRERHGNNAVLIGFSTYTGTVTAASDWDAAAERKRVRPGAAKQLRGIVSRGGVPRFQISVGEGSLAASAYGPPGLAGHRVIYRPEN